MASSTYRDERDAALAQTDALRRENEELRAEVEHLRALLDPAARREGFGALHGAIAATLVMVTAAIGGTLVAQDALTRAEAASARAVMGARIEAAVVEFEAAPPRAAATAAATAAPAPAAAPAVVAVTVGDPARAALAPALPRLSRCLAGWSGSLSLDLGFGGDGRVTRSEFRPRGRAGDDLSDDARRCAVEAAEAARWTTSTAAEVRVRYRLVTDQRGARVRSAVARTRS